jgi:hypothetical protein
MALGLSASLFLSAAQADPIANWKQLNTGVSTVTSDLDTDGPTFGDGSAANAQSAFMAGRFGTVAAPVTVTLALGQTLIVSGEYVLTGGAGGAADYRFGVFNDGGQFDANASSSWTGGWLHQPGNDIYRGRTDGAYISSAGNASALGATKNSTGTLNPNSATPLLWSMSITRDSATTVDISSSFTGGGGSLDQLYTANDVTTGNFTYTAAGLLFGGGSSLDQAVFSNVQFNVIPEPSSLALFLLGLSALAARARMSQV